MSLCCFLLLPIDSKSIVPLNDSSNFKLTASVVRSYVTVERPTGGKQIRKANQQKSGKARDGKGVFSSAVVSCVLATAAKTPLENEHFVGILSF